MYEAEGWIKFAEKDDFNKGCDPDSVVCHEGNDRFSNETLEGLIGDLMTFVGTDNKEDVLLWEDGDEANRIDIQCMEDENFVTASKCKTKDWKEGKRTLWLSCYTFRVNEVKKKPVDFSKELIGCGYSRS